MTGVHMGFQNTPGTEAPAEMNTCSPTSTPSGWLRTSSLAFTTSSPCADAKVLFHSHSWPRWGAERIQEVLRGERDMYANLDNQVLNLANSGVTIKRFVPCSTWIHFWPY